MLSDKDLAGLTTRLQVPSVAADILNGAGLDDDMRYALHELLSEMQPDSALLAIALAAQQIVQRYVSVNAVLAVLKMEAARVIEDYAQLWLENARNARIDEADALARLSYVPEDLESISELLETAAAALQMHDGAAAEFLRILMVQADAQGLIAEAFAEALVFGDEQSAEHALPANDFMGSPAVAVAAYADNVIQFPVRVYR